MKNAKIHSKMYKKSALINKSDKFIKTLNRNPYGEDKQISINQSSDNNINKVSFSFTIPNI